MWVMERAPDGHGPRQEYGQGPARPCPAAGAYAPGQGPGAGTSGSWPTSVSKSLNPRRW